MVQAKFGKKIECIMGYSKSNNTQFCSFSILEKRVLQTLLLACKKRKKFKTRFVSHINTKARPRRLRGSQLGQEKLVAKVSIMGKKAPGILLLMNQFHNLFAVFMIFLFEEVHPQTRFFAVTCLARAGQLSFRRVFGEMGPKKPKKFHNW